MARLALAPSEQALIIFALYKLLGTALVHGPIEISFSPDLALTYSAAQLRELIGKVETGSFPI